MKIFEYVKLYESETTGITCETGGEILKDLENFVSRRDYVWFVIMLLMNLFLRRTKKSRTVILVFYKPGSISLRYSKPNLISVRFAKTDFTSRSYPIQIRPQ